MVSGLEGMWRWRHIADLVEATDSTCTFAHRMTDPWNHTEVEELAKHLDDSTPDPA